MQRNFPDDERRMKNREYPFSELDERLRDFLIGLFQVVDEEASESKGKKRISAIWKGNNKKNRHT